MIFKAFIKSSGWGCGSLVGQCLADTEIDTAITRWWFLLIYILRHEDDLNS